MRAVLISGAVLVLTGLFLVIRGVSYTKEESVFKLGGFEANVKTERRVPQWVGGVALGAGAVLIVIGLKKR